jgi:prophage antirepressor-like protein
MNTNTIIYNNGEIELKVSLDSETIWLTQKDITQVFEKDQSVISRHINNIFKDKEVDEKSNMQKMHIGSSDKPVNLYSLDIILAVGYRANSAKAIQFRQWATTVLKDYIINGYSINTKKITIQKFENLELDIIELKKKQFNTDNKIENILNTIESKDIKPSQGIFYNGQIFDAYNFISDLIRDAKQSITLIDNYIDDSVLTLFSKNQNIDITIHTSTISKQLKQDIEKYNSQYKKITLKSFKDSHDRFLIIDDKEIYHIGASLKDLGKRWFAFSKLNIKGIDMLQKLYKQEEKIEKK